VLRLSISTGVQSCQVTVYNTTTFQPIRYSNLTYVDCYGIAVDPTINRLYLSVLDNNKIHALDLNTLKEISESPWSVPDAPYALSMNSVHNILVSTLYGGVYEYTSSGTPVRNIHGYGVYQAIEVSNGTLVMSSYSENDVRLISVDGTVLRSFGLEKDISPTGLTVDTKGFVLVADYGNNRILALDPTLTNSTIVMFPLNTTDKIVSPLSLWYDESRGRLYVGEYGGQYRVLVFDNLLSISDVLQP
jgi:DNA-binding beta-propeller fold protein YncE